MPRLLVLPIEALISNPFNPQVDDVYSFEHHSIPSLQRNKKNSNFGIKAEIVVYDVTETGVCFWDSSSKRMCIPYKEFAAYVSVKNLIPQYKLPIFMEFQAGNIQ